MSRDNQYYWIVRKSSTGAWHAQWCEHGKRVGTTWRFKTWREAMDWAAN